MENSESPVHDQPSVSAERADSPAVMNNNHADQQQQQQSRSSSKQSAAAAPINNNNANTLDDRTSSSLSVPIAPVTVFNDPPPPPPPQHPDYLGDLFQDAVASASLPAPFEGWTDLLTLPDSVLLSRISGGASDGPAMSRTGGTISSCLNAGILPGEVLTHPSRVLLRVLNRLSAEFRFLQMRQIDEADMQLQAKKESHGHMIAQMAKDNITKIKALLAQAQQAAAGNDTTNKKTTSSSSYSSPTSASSSGYDEMLAQTAINNLEKRLFTQQQQSKNVKRQTTNANVSLSAAGIARPQINESQRLKTYWRARYQQACVELEEVEQEIAIASQELFELDKVAGCNSNEQLKEMIERCRVAEENAHAFAESCRIEMKRAELAAARKASEEGGKNSINNTATASSNNNKTGPRSVSHQNNNNMNNMSFAGGNNDDTRLRGNSFINKSNLHEDNDGLMQSPNNNNNNDDFESSNNALLAKDQQDMANLPFLVESLSQHAPQAIQTAISIRLKTMELKQLETQFEQVREQVHRLEHAVEKAHIDYSSAVGRLPSHVSVNFEQVIKAVAQLEGAEDALFDAQSNLSNERMQFTTKRHETTLNIEKEKCKLMEQKDNLRRQLRSASLDLLRVERKRKEHPSIPITAKDFTSIENIMASNKRASVASSSSTTNKSLNNNNNSSAGNNNNNNDVADAASHLETMRARVKIYELERQSLLLEAMRAGTVPRPE